MYLDEFAKHFGAIDEPRQAAKVSHPLFNMMFFTMSAVIAGAEGWADIQEYAEGHLDWFQDNKIQLNGVLVDDTIARTISRIKHEQFRNALSNG